MTFVAAPNPSARSAHHPTSVVVDAAPTPQTGSRPPSSSSNQPLYMEQILERMLSEKGMAATGGGGQHVSMDQAIEVWNAVCRLCEETLLKGQTLVVPGMANVGVKKEVEHMGGIWKPKTSLTPHVTLAPAFVSQYCSTRFSTNTTDVKHGKTNPQMLNPSVVSSYSGVSRHQCQNLLKDAVRTIGQSILHEGKRRTVCVEMGFCTLEFAKEGSAAKGGFQVRWNQEFLAEFNDAMVAEARQLQQQADKVMGAPAHYVRPSSASSTGSRSPRQRQPTPAAKAATFAAANPPASPRVPKPPGAPGSSQGFRPKAGLGISGASPAQVAAFEAKRGVGRVSATPPLPFDANDVGSRCSSAHSSRCSTPRMHNTASSPPTQPTTYKSHSDQLRAYASQIHSAARGAQPRRPSSAQSGGEWCADASPRGQSGTPNWGNTLHSIARSTMTPFVKQKARKAIYRRMRGQAFEDSWGAQLHLKKQKEAEEKEAEKKRIELFKKAMSEQAAKEYNEKMGQRNEEREVAALNQALVAPRRAMQLPRAESPGDLFSSRKPPSRPPSRTKEILEFQMEDQKRRRERDREDDRAYQRKLVEQDARYNESQRLDKLRRRDEAQRLREEYDEQMEAKRKEEERFKATMPKSGCILYSENESVQDEVREMMEVKKRTRQFQQENKRYIDDKQTREAKEAAERHFINAERRRKEREDENERRMQERREREAIQAGNRATWTSQMKQRQAQKDEERDIRSKWRDHTYLKNESSDDEA